MTSDRPPSGLTRRDRGQSVSINYTLSLVIVSLMMSGLFVSMSGYLEGERERVTRSEFDVLGNRIAADVATVDRLARRTEGDTSVAVRTSIPSSVAGSSYSVTITSSPTPAGFFEVDIQMSAGTLGVTRNVSTKTEFGINSTMSGGPYVIRFDGSSMEAQND